MEYNQYKCLELYVNNEPQNVFKKGDLVKTGDFDNIEDCENNINEKGYFTWVNKTDNKIKIETNNGWITVTVSPYYVGKPTYLKFRYEAQQNLNPYAINITSLDITRINTSSIEDMSRMFAGCSSLGSLDLSNFNTANVKTMNGMFQGCYKLVSLDLSKFNTSNCTNFGSMFANCSSLGSLDLSKFNTANVGDMAGMFQGCSKLVSLDLSNFDTSNCTNFGAMFDSCSSLGSLDLSKFNTSNCTNFGSMFDHCSSLGSLDLSSFNTSKSTFFAKMFDNCTSLVSLDLSNFDMRKAKANYCGDMFSYCNKLTHIKCKQAFKDWCITHQDIISLPTAMREGGSGTWEIVG